MVINLAAGLDSRPYRMKLPAFVALGLKSICRKYSITKQRLARGAAGLPSRAAFGWTYPTFKRKARNYLRAIGKNWQNGALVITED